MLCALACQRLCTALQRSAALSGHRSRPTPRSPSTYPFLLALPLWRSHVLAAAQSGQLGVSEALQAVRALAERAITSRWRTGDRGAAQAGSDLLDEANELLGALLDGSSGGAAGGGVTAAHAAAPGDGHEGSPAPAGLRSLPDESEFFLPPDQVRDFLTLNVDGSILMAAGGGGGRRGGLRKRKPGEGSAASGGEPLLVAVGA